MPAAPNDAHHLRFAIFHDGNPGHLWRGEFGSMLGEAVVAAGVVMWLALLTSSPMDVAYALIAMGLPALVAGPLGATLTRVEEPARLFKLFGRLRVAFALALIAMHYLTILPVLYLLLFGISLCGRLRSSLRVAAMRACLAPGEPERVAASTHFAAVIVAVVGPLLASFFFILNGERILLVSIGAAAIFLLSTSADALVDALPPQRRAFLLARPEQENADDRPDVGDPDGESGSTGEVDDDAEGAGDIETLIERREAALPEWDQWGPGTVGEAIADLKAGLRLAGSAGASTTALRALAALALVGGGVSVFEVFYVTDHLLQPTFYLGALLAAEGAGLAVGATLWSDLGRRGRGKGAMLIGTIATGLALALLASATAVPLALMAAIGVGVGNAVAVEGAREALRAGFDGVERRALAAAESLLAAICGITGAALFVLFHHGYDLKQHGAAKSATLLAALTPSQLFFIAGLGLVAAAIVHTVLMQGGGFLERERARQAAQQAAKGRSGARGRVPPGSGGFGQDDPDDLDASGAFPAAGGGWDDDESDDGGYGEPNQRWDDESDEYQDSRYGPTYDDPRDDDSRYERSYGAESRVGWDDEEPEDDEWAPPRGGGRSGPRTPPRGGRGGWR